jgi:small conductance mechanosensitive channel
MTGLQQDTTSIVSGASAAAGSAEQGFSPEGFLDTAVEIAFRLIPRIALALLVLLVFVGLAFVIRTLLRRVFRRARLEEDVAEILQTLTTYLVMGFGVVLALDNLGLNVTSIVAGLGIMGIALGFAAKDTLANLIAGVTILWDRPFRVGDRIEVEGSMGIVRKITLRTTRLDTQRNEVVILPNQTMVTEKIINHTMRPRLRVDIPVGIAYGADIAAAREALLATLQGDDNIREKPEPQVVVTELAPSSVNLELRFWLQDPKTEIAMRLRYTESAKQALDAAGIEIPFPQLTLHTPETSDGSQINPVRVADDVGAEKAHESV